MRFSLPYDHILTAASLTGKSVYAILTAAKSLGFDGVDMESGRLNADTEKMLADVRRADMRVFSLSLPVDTSSEEAIDAVAQTVRLGEMHGIHHITLLPCHTKASSDTLAETAAFCDAAAATATACGVHLSVMNLSLEIASVRTTKDFSALADLSDRITFTVHTGNLFRLGEDPTESVLPLLKRTARLILSDVTAEERTYGDTPAYKKDDRYYYPCPVGFGDVGYGKLLPLLKERHYNGILTCEHYLCDDTTHCIGADADFLLKTLKL